MLIIWVTKAFSPKGSVICFFPRLIKEYATLFLFRLIKLSLRIMFEKKGLEKTKTAMSNNILLMEI